MCCRIRKITDVLNMLKYSNCNFYIFYKYIFNIFNTHTNTHAHPKIFNKFNTPLKSINCNRLPVATDLQQIQQTGVKRYGPPLGEGVE